MDRELKITFKDFRSICDAGIRTAELNFVDALITGWLKKYPYDIQANVKKAEIDFYLGSNSTAKDRINSTIERDPENLAAYELLFDNGEHRNKNIASAIHCLSGRTTEIKNIFPWAVTLRAVRNEIRRGNFSNAQKMLASAMAEDPNNQLIAIEHFRLALGTESATSRKNLINIYNQRWGKCIYFKIWKALHLMDTNQENEAVAMLHSCVREDPGGVIVKKLMGVNHEYLSLWPEDRYIFFNQQIPSGLSVSLDWTLLKSGDEIGKVQKLAGEYTSNDYEKLKKEITTGARKSDESELVYVILSSHFGLTRKYGPKSAEIIINHLEKLAETFKTKPKWESVVFIPDNAEYLRNLGINPIHDLDPWKIKLSLMDFCKLLKNSGKKIGALVIIGNHEVVPFHRLPNPTDDSDKDVLSDNPYATSSSNYLIPEWSIGRIPGEKGADPGLLIAQIRNVTKYHASLNSEGNIIKRIIKQLTSKFGLRRILKDWLSKPKDFGYSAEVWQRSSLASFRPLGKGSDLRICPPYEQATIDIDNLMKAKCAYFNLHGLSNTSEWYGQRDFSVASIGPDFPIAISAKDLTKYTNNIDLVFTEACYGGYVLDKSIDESIALKLISIASQGVVGSTCISYGSVFTPLIGGDLLGFVFWKYIKDGYSFGASLMHAKIGLIKVMMQRQGYLDGEDQKTLLSFVLYGDPLGYLEPNIYLDALEEETYPNQEIYAFSDKDGIPASETNFSSKVTDDLSEILESYIPGLSNADVKIRRHKLDIHKMKVGSSNQERKLGTNLDFRNLTQLQYQKSFFSENRRHTQYARITMDSGGKIIKLAVSR